MKKVLIFGLPVLLLVGLFMAKTIFLAPAPPDPKKLAAEPGAVYTMATPFVVNLADGDGTPHFAKVGVALRRPVEVRAQAPICGSGESSMRTRV